MWGGAWEKSWAPPRTTNRSSIFFREFYSPYNENPLRKDPTMNINSHLVVSSTCTLILTGVAAYSAYQQKKLNTIIEKGAAQMAADTERMFGLIPTAQ